MTLKNLCIETYQKKEQTNKEREDVTAEAFVAKAFVRLNEVLNYNDYCYYVSEVKIDYASQMRVLEKHPTGCRMQIEDMEFIIRMSESNLIVRLVKTCGKCGEKYESFNLTCKADIGHELTSEFHSLHTCKVAQPASQSAAEQLEELIRGIARGAV